MPTERFDPRRYDPALAKPGQEAFRRYTIAYLKRGTFALTHVPARPQAECDDTPLVPFGGRGGGPSGAPLPPTPSPQQRLG